MNKISENGLPLPKYLCPNISPQNYLKSPEIYEDENKQILLGILIENYSRYPLTHPRFEPGNSGAELVTEKLKVSPHSTEFFIIRNSNNIYGSLSWEFGIPGVKSKGTRLVLTYWVYWSGSCKGGRGNEYHIYFDDIDLKENDNGKKVLLN